MALAVGTVAPDFTTVDDEGKTVSLSDYKGKVVVLYFYPKDDTPGCTKEAQSFRDNYQQYQDKEMVVFGSAWMIKLLIKLLRKSMVYLSNFW
jgi:peroxiredoxin Q/BCP